MKNIFKIFIHPLTYIMIIICLLTGQFKAMILFMILIVFHELGHILLSLYFKWRIHKVIILPFGALTIFQEHLNKPIYQELIIIIAGPLFQQSLYLLLREYQLPNLVLFNYSILLFNLLPIYPLDGSKLLNVVLSKIIPFKKSYQLVLAVSYITIILLIITSIRTTNLLLCLIILLLTFKVINETFNLSNIVNKFQFERYLYSFVFYKNKQIHSLNLSKMYRDYNHLFYNGEYYITEHEMLQKKFDFKDKL